jgi:hypothetical protein
MQLTVLDCYLWRDNMAHAMQTLMKDADVKLPLGCRVVINSPMVLYDPRRTSPVGCVLSSLDAAQAAHERLPAGPLPPREPWQWRDEVYEGITCAARSDALHAVSTQLAQWLC